MADFALHLQVAAERVGERGRHGKAFVLADRALILVEARGAPQRHGQPAAEGVLDRNGDLAREDAGDAGKRRFGGGGPGGELDGGQRGRRPDQRPIDQEAT